MNRNNTFYLIILLLSVFTFSCNEYFFRSNYNNVNDLVHGSDTMLEKPFLKAHLKNGFVYILDNRWEFDTNTNSITGFGSLYGINRLLVSKGHATIPINNVSIFETNSKLNETEVERIAALSLLAGVDIAVGIFCLTNPKACFGSCPTFYLNKNDNFHYADAEGFSNAISPSMEYGDIDALCNTNIIGDSFSITMKNEALETHCVNNVNLLAYPTNKGERVYQSQKNDFYLCQNDYQVFKATADEGNIISLINNNDKTERFSHTDSKNLSSKEEIYIDFKNVKDLNNLGLIINFRQTLLSTYLFYSAMGYMGNKVSDMFAKIESDSFLRNNFDAAVKELGNIEVYVWNDMNNTWEFNNQFNETGPIAINKQIVLLKNNSNSNISNIKVKLVLNKGLWRIDYLALTNIKDKVAPIMLNPISILNKGKLDNNALKSILNTEKHLISMPGSEYEFNFKLPKKNIDYELFLYSKGYYLEWMRQHWIKDKNLLKLKQMVYNPKKYLKHEAPNFKKYESYMEQEFWNSKVDTKTFSYDEK